MGEFALKSWLKTLGWIATAVMELGQLRQNALRTSPG
jgi:hypothetical protein